MKGFKGFHRFPISGMAAVLFSCLLVLSCSDDIIESSKDRVGKHSDNICFGISPADEDWTKASAGTGAASVKDTEYYVLRAENSSDTLCLRATVTDGISVSAFGNDAPETRSAQVVSLETYGSFRVQAHCTDAGVPVGVFYMDDVADNLNAGVWSTRNVYYWPGEDRTLRFFAWAPVDAAFTSVPESPENTVLGYEVPQAVADQKDVVVAVTSDMPGNSNTEVPLGFRHICSAIRFEFGSEMQPGTIKSVALKNVKYAGSYDMASDTWTLNDGVASFTQDLGLATTGNEADGDSLTTPEGTFMMVPQTLPDGAEVEVVFVDGVTGQEREPMTVSIAGSRWPQGMTVTYKLSITPEYEFRLETNPVLDAHYEILKTNLIVSVPDNVSWTITGPTLNGKAVTIQSQNDMNNFAQNGFWTDRMINQDGNDTGSARGTSSYQGRGSGLFPIAVFIPENVGDGSRIIDLFASVNGNAATSIGITQLSPSWYGNGLGCERLQSVDSPWGFYWSSGFSITYDLRNCDESSRVAIREYVEWTKALHTLVNIPFLGILIGWIFGTDIPDLSFVDMEKSGGFLGIGGRADEVTINLGELRTEANVALSYDNGQQNTREIYNFEGIQLVNRLIAMLEAIPGCEVSTTGTGLNPTDNAAITCMELNSWNIVDARDEQILKLTDVNDIPEWYLPSRNEIDGIEDLEYPLSKEGYWTSTAINDSETAFLYTPDGIISTTRRDEYHHVRAVRKKP